MRRTGTLIVGGGQAGLALSRHLVEAGQDHVVIERGRVGERWRSERWDSLRLLSPNWLSSLPWMEPHPDPDGFMACGEFVSRLDGWARGFGAPVREGVTVLSVRPACEGFEVVTDDGEWRARQVVIATGDCDTPMVPGAAAAAPGAVASLHAAWYRNPSALPDGPVLVVGAGATGQQIASELAAAGRPVVLAVGRHARMVRRYRGRDIFAWLSATGAWERRLDDVSNRERTLAEANIAVSAGGDLSLGALAASGVVLTGRLLGFTGRHALFGDDLQKWVRQSDDHMLRALDRIDQHIAASGVAAPAADPVERICVPSGPASLDVSRFGAIVWSSGYARRYPWLHAPIALRPDGELVHRNGATPVPGLSVIGLRFLRRRASHFIGGVGADAEHLAARIVEADRPRARRPGPVTLRAAA